MVLFSCEAKYISGSYATCQIIWIESVLSGLKIQVKKPLILQLNNKSAISLANNSVLRGRANI